MNTNTNNGVWRQATTLGSFLFFSFMLSVPSGYSYGSAFLLLTSMAYLACLAVRNGHADQAYMPLTREDRAIMLALLGVFAVAVATTIIHGNDASMLDVDSRCLLAVPILVLAVKAPPRLEAVWAGLVVGCIVAAGIAAWQVYSQGIPRATGFVTSAVPFGNLGLTMAIFCFAGMFWARAQPACARQWQAVLLLGCGAGVYVSVASGSRGGWLALAPVSVLFCIAFLNRQNWRKATIATALAAAVLGGVFVAPQDSYVRARYDEAVRETGNYLTEENVETSIGGRLEAWRGAAIAIPKKPLLGWSHADYAAELRYMVQTKQLRPYVLELVNTHNNYLQAWLFQGAVGLSALMALYIFPFWFFCRRLRAADMTVRVLAVCGASLLVAFFTYGMTHVILGRNNGM
ncbi:MAG TPA: O-antigen ligase family protein, partial [Candidimonas sp.]|nr:O-antigen ligase family protein [Candidimonas sp.]